MQMSPFNFGLSDELKAIVEATNRQVEVGTLLKVNKSKRTVDLATGTNADVVATAGSDYGEISAISLKTTEQAWFVRVKAPLAVGAGIVAGTGDDAGVAVAAGASAPIAYMYEATTGSGVGTAYNL